MTAPTFPRSHPRPPSDIRTGAALHAFLGARPILFSAFADQPEMLRALGLAMAASHLDPDRAIEAHAIVRAECLGQLRDHGAVDMDVAGLCERLYDLLDLTGYTWDARGGQWTAPVVRAA